MPSLAAVSVLVRELLTRERCSRVPEPDLVMNDPEKVAAFTRAGREDGVMAQSYLFNCAHICEIIRPGDEMVVDLACGPATQLAMVARLNPDSRFVGIDLSENMVEIARNHINQLEEKKILPRGQVEIRLGDITDLDINDGRVDSIFSTLSLHHLPSTDHLGKCFSEVDRVLKNDGGLYLSDFSRLKSEKSISYFAHQYADQQPELFTQDYFNSLKAAFSLSDYKKATQDHLASRAKLYSMFLVPFMVVVKSSPRRNADKALIQSLDEIRQSLPKDIKRDLNDLIIFFKKSGLSSSFLS